LFGLLNGVRAGQDNVVGIATCYRLDGPEIESRWGRDFLHPFRRALGPIHPLIRYTPGHARD